MRIYNSVGAEPALFHVVSILRMMPQQLFLFQYEFWLEDGRQEYRMDCLLCGFAEDSLSVMPYDPRKASAFHET
jgi:hypothetical protein